MPGCPSRQPNRVVTQYGRGSLLGAKPAGKRPQRGGLARTIEPHHRDDLTRTDLDIETGKRRLATERMPDGPQLQHGHCVPPTASRSRARRTTASSVTSGSVAGQASNAAEIAAKQAAVDTAASIGSTR